MLMMFAFGSLCWRGAKHVSVLLKISRAFYEGKRSKNADCYGFPMDAADVPLDRFIEKSSQ
jgi:hypothetical protein